MPTNVKKKKMECGLCECGEWEEGEGKENKKKRNRVSNKQRKHSKHADSWSGGADCPEARAPR